MDNQVTDTLSGIKLTKDGKTPMKEIELVTDQSRADVLVDPIRTNILRILKEGVTDFITSTSMDPETGDRIIREKEVTRGALSAVEIVNRSKEPENGIEPFSLSQAYHHLSKLIEHGYVIKFGTVTKGKRTTDYYRRCANTFIFNLLPGKPAQTIEERMKLARDQMSSYTDQILELFDFKLNMNEREKLVDLLTKTEIIRLETQSFSKIVNLSRSDITTMDQMEILHDVINIYLIKNDEWVRESRKLHDFLFSKI